ncbi:hypothetical protein PVK06_010574 [Gossypium arboreum]|uniref:Uncharacterized protein n=1 Tax=Gossypium arboreum TaxID=29729 RepID=A0ABR0Q6E8_GOSAR|nr:hypothetical protein PVK06_010574 [Gossypium arboreum]
MTLISKGGYLKDERVVDEVVVSGVYKCTTMAQKTWRVLRCRCFLQNHPKYEFSVPSGTHHLSVVCGPDNSGGRHGFYFPMYVLEASFHLPVHLFIREILNTYGMALGYLIGIS